jgi:hypothetical protein
MSWGEYVRWLRLLLYGLCAYGLLRLWLHSFTVQP